MKLKIIKQIIATMAYIHSTGIVHRDLKSHNILLDQNYNVKICDFGLAKYNNDLSWGSGQFSGTPAYMAPELFLKKNLDEKIDVFAFGTLMWEILVRKIPYEGYDVLDIKNKVVNDETIIYPKNFPPNLMEIINKCRALDRNKRPKFSELSIMEINIK